ncbi:hypothetical protein BDE36_0205 [Arcticibacter tournemirensis]|nr:hypothetical protein BDE36_0205 [Arcticibacter tournemirensis]
MFQLINDEDEVIDVILEEFQKVINNCLVGLLETGDLLFLFCR